MHLPPLFPSAAKSQSLPVVSFSDQAMCQESLDVLAGGCHRNARRVHTGVRDMCRYLRRVDQHFSLPLIATRVTR